MNGDSSQLDRDDECGGNYTEKKARHLSRARMTSLNSLIDAECGGDLTKKNVEGTFLKI